MKRSKVLARLSDAQRNGRIVTVVRDDFELTTTHGYVIASNDSWIALHTIAFGVHLDDISLVRVKDISRVSFGDDDPYHHRAILGLGVAVAAFEMSASDGTRELLLAAKAAAPIIALGMENTVGEPLIIGR